MEGQELKDGKARVRLHLIEPLVSGGMMRKRGQKVEEHERFLSSLEARLAYMAADRLQALAVIDLILQKLPQRVGRRRTSGLPRCRS